MSNQEISRFSTKTNSRTGDSKQVYLHVEGPVCVAGATTKERVYEDNANRSFLLQSRKMRSMRPRCWNTREKWPPD